MIFVFVCGNLERRIMMKLNREKLLKDYLDEISRICDLEEMEFKTHFTPEEIVDIICNMIDGGIAYGKVYPKEEYFDE